MKHNLRRPLLKAIRIAGSESELARRVGCSQAAINKAKVVGRVSPVMACRIEIALAGKVSKTDLRPDLFPAEPQPTRRAA